MKIRSYLKEYFDKKSKYLFALCVLVYIAAAYFVCMSFFENRKAACILTVCGMPFFIKKLMSYIYTKRQRAIEDEFYFMLRQISMSLSSGNTLSNAVKETVITDRKSYRMIGSELERVYGMLRNNCSAEDAFRAFAKRCGNREITAFSEVLCAGVPAGVNLNELIRYVSSSLRTKADVEQEIRRMLNAPKYNNRIIMAMPVFCIVMFRGIAPSYLAPLYAGTGRFVMAAVLVLIVFAWFIGERISNIRY